MSEKKEITLNQVTKIEGHARLELAIDQGKITKCELSAIEGSRYFEGLVVGRKWFEAHEMTSRICGICSTAHVIAAVRGIEQALGIIPSQQTRELRELIMLGERIRSHATHLYFLALPDYVGYESALAMAGKFKKELTWALHLMKAGNSIIKTLAARELHPVSATPGGWLKLPSQDDLAAMKQDLLAAKEDAIRTCELFFDLDYPEAVTVDQWFSIMEPDRYGMMDGKMAGRGVTFDHDHYTDFLKEYHEPRSTANFVVKGDKRYFVGALARLNNNQRWLSADAKRMLKKAPFDVPSINPYHNTMAQAIELVHAIDHAIQICSTITIKPEPIPKITPKAGRGVGAAEAPRGTLFHEYILDKNGVIKHCNIITPTAQNLLNIQEDIRAYVPRVLHKKQDAITLDVEKLIRAYDPCFSCSAHFLEVDWQ